MLHLQAGVHFQKVKVFIFIDQKLDGTGTAIMTGFGGIHCGFTHTLAQLWINKGRGRLFYHFLVSALNRAIPFAQINRIAMLIGKHLNFNMARFDNRTL